MDRRGFLKVALGVTGAAAALVTLPAEAMPRMAPVPQTGSRPGEAPAAAIATPEDIAEAKVENVYWGWRPWRRRRYGWGWRRRRWWW
jgi:hypothetical protein